MAISLPPCQLTTLPPELTSLVLNRLEQSSLLQVRLSCRTLSAYATPRAFENLTVWLEEASLQNVVNIAQQKRLAPLVKHLSCGMEQFHDVSFEVFKASIYPPWSYGEGPAADKDDQKAAWKAYRMYARKQRILDSSGLGTKMMAKALRSFTNLISIEITGYNPQLCYRTHGTRMLRQEPNLRRHMLSAWNPRCRLSRGSRQLSTVIQALTRADRFIRELYLDAFDFETDNGGLFAPLELSDEIWGSTAFARLERLEVDMHNLFMAPLAPEYSSLSSIKTAATNLKHLYVQLPDVDDSSKNSALWKDVICTKRARSLETLIIGGAILNETNFVEFLRKSCWELRSFTLRNAKVIDSSWNGIYDALRKIASLTKVNLGYLRVYEPLRLFHALSGETYGAGTLIMEPQPLYDFLLRKTDVNPWDGMCEDAWAIIVKEWPTDESEDGDENGEEDGNGFGDGGGDGD